MTAPIEIVPDFRGSGIVAFTTTKHTGDFSLTSSRDASADVFGRWIALGSLAERQVDRIACAHQVHGTHVIEHGTSWTGFLRCSAADGHFSHEPRTLMAVTLADCVPIFIAHASGAAAVLHSGWKGTVANIALAGIRCFVDRGIPAGDLTLHCGPAICGNCYQVGPEVYAALTGRTVDRPTPVDLRAIIASQARAAGVQRVTVSDRCTRCHNDRFFSHRCGDSGRQVGVVCLG